MRILLVEGEASLGEVLSAGLVQKGFVVDLATTLAIAEDAIQCVDYNAILLDRTLPDGEGLNLLALVRTPGPHCPGDGAFGAGQPGAEGGRAGRGR